MAQANVDGGGNTDHNRRAKTPIPVKPNPEKAEALDFYVTALLPRLERGIGDMHRIGEPTKDREEFDAAVRALDQGLTNYKSEIQTDPVKALTAKTTAFDTAIKRFAEFGEDPTTTTQSGQPSTEPRFKECSKPFI